MIYALSLALSALKVRPLFSFLSALSVASGIALLCALFLLTQNIETGISRNSQNIDVVIGAKGSPLQLVLSSVYQADIPNGNINMAELQKLEHHPQVRTIVPIAIGDNYKGWRVVGTTAGYLDLYGAKIQAGRVFEKPFEVVAGAATQMKIGDTFAAAHGFAASSDDVHDFQLYEVVGTLVPSGTVADKLLITPLESVQQLHAHHEKHEDHADSTEEESMEHQVTALLIEVRSPLAVMTLPRQINRTGHLLAASPTYEMARLSKSMGVGENFVLALSAGIIVLSILMLFSSLASGLTARQYDLAVLRVLGASPPTVFATVMFEGMLIGVIGALCGLVFGHVMAFAAATQIETLRSVMMPADFLLPQRADLYLLVMGVASGGMAALIPAVSAARIDIANLLARGSS